MPATPMRPIHATGRPWVDGRRLRAEPPTATPDQTPSQMARVPWSG